MDKDKKNTTSVMGRPPLYEDHVEVWVRMERATLDKLLEKYPGASKSRAVSLELEKSLGGNQ